MADTTTEEKPIEDQTADELAKTIAASAVETEETQVTGTSKDGPSEYTHTAADGTVYKAASATELLNTVANALNTTKVALKDREHQIHDLRKTPVPAKTEIQPGTQYDHARYLELLADDSRGAYEYQKSFDPDIQALRAEREQKAEVSKIQDEVSRFYRDVPVYAAVETKEVNDLMRARLEEKGRPYTAEALGLSYYELKNEGKIPESGKPVERKKAMPVSAAGSGSTTESEPDYDNMSAVELTAYMKKTGVPGAEYIR